MVNRDPLFALRRSARNRQFAAIAPVFAELNAATPASDKPLHIVFVHGGLSCCFDAFADLFPRIQASLRELGVAAQTVSLLRFEHDTYQPIRTNAERLCALVRQKLALPPAGMAQPELVFVAHSRGGLVARLASDLLIERGLWNKDRLEVFTYGSPHRGTPFFESEVTFMVDRLIRWSGIAGFGLLRFFHDLRLRGAARTLRRNYHAWRRPGALMGLGAGSSTLALGRMISGRMRAGATTVRDQGPSILSWPPGIEDVRESSVFFSQISPQPHCSRFWTFGSTYDLRRNPQKLDVASRYILQLVQKAFVLLTDPIFSEPAPSRPVRATRATTRAAGRETECNDLVVTIASATAIGRGFRVEENLWHCGYFKGSPGEKLARYLRQALEFAQSGGLTQRTAFDEMA
jgi:hypothetical protein